MNSFDKLLTNISWMYDKGYPDFTIKEDREALYDYLLSIGFPHSAVIELSERFIREKEETFTARKKDSGNIVAFKSKENRDNAIKSGDYEEVDKKDGDDKEEKPKGKKIGGSEYERGAEEEPKAEPKAEPKDEPKDEIDVKIEKQQKEFEKRGLDDSAIPTKDPENPNFDEKFATKKDGPLKVHDGLDKANKAVQETQVIPDEDKKNISSAIQKIKEEKVETMTDDEINSLRRWVAVKDQKGQPDESKRSAEFYIADISPNDWRFGNKSVGGGEPARQARKKATMTGGKGKAVYDELTKLADAVGLKMASPTNSRTTSKMMAPTAINGKRKEEKIKIDKKKGKVVSASIAGQTHTKKSVPRISDVEKALIEKGMDAGEAKRKARKAVLGIQRYNDQIDLLAETAEASNGKLEVVDYGDTSTTEGKKTAINQCLQDLANTLEEKLESTTPPHPPLSRSHYELQN